LRVHPLSKTRADRIHPVDGLESKLSLQHAVSIVLLRGEAGVRNFTDEAAKDPTVHTCREKIKVITDESLSTDEAQVLIRLKNGEEIIRKSSGSQALMSSQALEKKFRELVDFGAPHCNADELLKNLSRFQQIANVSELISKTTLQF